MAQRRVVILEDDLDGGEAAESITFGLDGVTYEIDLSEAHAEELREALSPYVTAGRRTGGRRKSRADGKNTVGGKTDRAAIREWARKNGHNIGDRGRIPAAVVQEYNDAH